MQNSDSFSRRRFIQTSSLAAGAALVAPKILFTPGEDNVCLGPGSLDEPEARFCARR